MAKSRRLWMQFACGPQEIWMPRIQTQRSWWTLARCIWQQLIVRLKGVGSDMVRYSVQNFFGHRINPRFARNSELAFRGSFLFLLCAIPVIIPENVSETRDTIIRYCTASTIVAFVVSLCSTWENFRRGLWHCNFWHQRHHPCRTDGLVVVYNLPRWLCGRSFTRLLDCYCD